MCMAYTCDSKRGINSIRQFIAEKMSKMWLKMYIILKAVRKAISGHRIDAFFFHLEGLFKLLH